MKRIDKLLLCTYHKHVSMRLSISFRLKLFMVYHYYFTSAYKFLSNVVDDTDQQPSKSLCICQ